MSDETTCRTCGGEDGFRVTKGGVVVSDEQAAFDKKLMHFITAVKEGDTGPVIYGIYLFMVFIYGTITVQPPQLRAPSGAH